MSKIYALGPDGSYSSKAAKKVNKGLDFDVEYKNNIKSVIDSTVHSFYGIIPVYNIYGGIVEESYENLSKNKDALRILFFIKLQINHCLASAYGENNPGGIHTIYSHPQAIKQCQSYLNNIQAVCVPINSTTEKNNYLKPGEGVICSQDSAHMSGLKVIESNIAPSDNVTTFAFLANLEYLEKIHSI